MGPFEAEPLTRAMADDLYVPFSSGDSKALFVNTRQIFTDEEKNQGSANLGVALVVTPEQFLAVGDGTTDDAASLQEALDFLADAGGGELHLTPGKIYGWTGILIVGSGVFLVGNATRQQLADTDPPTIPGLVALSATSQLRIGDWTSGSAPGGARNVYVDGNKIGANGTAKAGLVRIAGVNLYIENLFVHRSAGDNIVYDGVQNSTIVGGASTFAVGGAALVIDNGAGALAFHGGYYGTSTGGALIFRDTVGEASLYPFGPVQINFYGTIFESYDINSPPHAAHVHIRCGQSNVFHGCNFTGGAPNTAASTMLVDNLDAAVASTVRLDNCLWYTSQGQDAVRVVGSQWVFFSGINQVSDDGTHHAPSFVCADAGYPHVSIEGEVLTADSAGGTNVFREINGGSVALTGNNADTPPTYRLRLGQLMAIKHETDSGYRLTLDQDGVLRWYHNSTSVIQGSLYNDQTSGQMIAGGNWNLGNGFIRRIVDFVVSTVGASVTLDASVTGSNAIYLLFQFTTCTITSMTLSNGVEGSELRIGIYGTGVNSITWASNINFLTTAPQPIDGKYQFVDLVYTNGAWQEVDRTGNGAAAAHASAHASGGADSTDGYQLFTSAGSFVVPANVTRMYAKVVGAGAGGCSGGCMGNAAGSTGLAFGGPGGGIGTVNEQTITVTPGQTLTVTPGAAGVGGTIVGPVTSGVLNGLAGLPGTAGGRSSLTGTGVSVNADGGGVATPPTPPIGPTTGTAGYGGMPGAGQGYNFFGSNQGIPGQGAGFYAAPPGAHGLPGGSGGNFCSATIGGAAGALPVTGEAAAISSAASGTANGLSAAAQTPPPGAGGSGGGAGAKGGSGGPASPGGGGFIELRWVV